ncbi:hypothetical protein Godav_019226 [Gossypium davidsonii]|uniref:DUF7745 domain-containing protein n=4 Tax=Gossypium TaxID=3633 RepID=A0A7J8QZ06_GOSDV|nr:hypothetical protein [Gossypium davidsonii]MBA0641762.1 hypothetical protein [Gossypium klotzschianum]
MYSPELNSIRMSLLWVRIEESTEDTTREGWQPNGGYVSELWDFTRISVTQNNLQELKEVWYEWDDETKQLFYFNYGDLPYLLNVKVDKLLLRALAQYLNLVYSCFTFGKLDLVPTVEEYTNLLRFPRKQANKAYSRAVNVLSFLKRLMSITGMMLGHINDTVSGLFDRLDKRVTSVPGILVKTFRSLSACRRAVKEGLSEFVATPRRDNILEEKWMAILQSLQDEDTEWRAPWMIPDEILSRQFILATQGLAQCEFVYKGDNYKKKVREISNAWNQTHRMKRFFANPMTTLKYDWWWGKRVNDNVPMSSQENTRSIEEHLQVIPFELEIIKQDFEKRSSEVEKKIEQLEEEKMQLGLEIDVQKLEAQKMRKRKNKAEEDLESLKTNYKKLRLSIRTAELGKTPEQWWQEIKQKISTDQWEKKCQDARVREDALERDLLESQNEKVGLRARVAELERSPCQYRSRNSAIELKASLNKIEEFKRKIEELETTL